MCSRLCHGRRSGSQCKARYSNLVALGTAQRLPRAGAARPLSVRLREDYRGAAILPDQPQALTLQMRSRGDVNFAFFVCICVL